jgi:hypothetical protein
MTKSEQELLHLPIRFLSFGYVQGKMYWLNDDKRRRYFVIPPVYEKSKRQYNTFIYGGVFVINDFQEYERALASYYNCSIPYLGEIIQEDLYYSQKVTITPIKFKTLQELEECSYTSLSDIEGITFLGNQSNSKVQKSLKYGTYYRRASGIDVPNFLTMITENRI